MFLFDFSPSILLRSPLYSFIAKIANRQFQNGLEKEACFLASSNLIDNLEKNRIKAGGNSNIDLKLALRKYQTRMQTRCTPYGLFAGNTVMRWGYESSIVLGKPNEFVRSTKLDMQYWGELIKTITQLPYVKHTLNYVPNTSLYKLGDKLRYVEYKYENNIRKYHISSIDFNEYLEAILTAANEGTTYSTLVSTLASFGINSADAKSFVNETIDAQVLVSELEPMVTGNEYLEFILSKIEHFNLVESSAELTQLSTILTKVKEKLTKIDENKINEQAAYTHIHSLLNELPTPIDESKLFQVDMFRHCSNATLQIDYQQDLQKTIWFLCKIPLSNSKTTLEEFKDRFYTKYEDNEVPLLKALDNETGVGYLQNNGDSTPLVDDVFLPNRQEEQKFVWGQWVGYLQGRIENSLTKGMHSITLDDTLFKDLKIPESTKLSLPDTMAVMFSHVGNSKLLLHSVGGSSAGNLIGRFANANEGINEILQAITKVEQELTPHAILAEIVHLPESRTGNILHRPKLRDYEIPYLAQSSLPKENQISVSDLMISVKNDRIFLRSKKHNKEVLPRLTNAHNYSMNALPVYQFLCDMQTQDNVGGVYFTWGALENMYSFLPRVEYGNVILSPASWQLKKDAFKHLLKVDDATLLEEINLFRAKYKMPQRIAIADGDNELMIDLEDFWSVKMMLDTIKNREGVKLVEFLFDPDTAIVKDVDGNPYTNQFIAFLIKEKPEIEPLIKHKEKSKKPKELDVQRSFSLGSEWLYYKIYCGYKTADRVLAEIIKPLTEQLLAQKLITQWFFIRYADPDPHIRVRFKLTEKKNLGDIIDLFSKQIAQFEQWGLVWKIQTDTYKRELERYGKNSMELAEQLFFYDSIATTAMIDLIEGDEGEVIRWKYSIRAIDELLSGFGYNLSKKGELLESLKIGFAQEFNMNRDLKKQIDKKFRDNRTAIEEVLDRTKDADSELLPLFEILEHKNTQEAPVIASLLTLEKNNELMLPLDNLLSSFIHMLVNRLFKSKQRVHELVIYDFMYRHYRSSLAKQKNQQKEKVLVNGSIS